ncbi:MAG: DUF4332 domain-containing protein [Pseudanabaenaceae cyanobacterium bins.39]|nr:DUF4332 domain-containing protein [Pseudanabaenaceae cyanobacterium bins.39]
MNNKRNQNSNLISANFPIEQIPGLSKENSKLLQQYGIATTLDLLQRAGKSKAQRESLAINLGVRLQMLNKWLAIADLSRIPAIGLEYSGTILHSGIASVEQLIQTPVHQLYRQVMKLQVQNFHRSDLCPSLGEMSLWLQQAKSLH